MSKEKAKGIQIGVMLSPLTTATQRIVWYKTVGPLLEGEA